MRAWRARDSASNCPVVLHARPDRKKIRCSKSEKGFWFFRPRPPPRPPPTPRGRGRGRRTNSLRLEVHFARKKRPLPSPIELSGRVEIEPQYFVHLPDADYFVLVAGGNYPAAATRYDHAHVAARQDKVFLTRSYWPNGSKRWFQHAGRDFYFVVPRNKISLVLVKGYFFVPVLVNGLALQLNVSGGTSDDGWADSVRQQVSVGIGFTKPKLDVLAEAALPPAEAFGKVGLELTELSPGDAANFVELLADQICRSRLEKGHQLFLEDGWNCDGSRGPLLVESKSARHRFYMERQAESEVVDAVDRRDPVPERRPAAPCERPAAGSRPSGYARRPAD